LGGRKGIWPAKTKWWGAGVVICLEQGADLHMAQLMPLPLTVSCFSKIQIVLPFWYRLNWVVPDKGPLNGCMYVSVTVFTFNEFIRTASISTHKALYKQQKAADADNAIQIWTNQQVKRVHT